MGVITVSQLNRYLASRLSADEHLRSFLIRGEVSNFTRAASGHCYFSLKDAESIIPAVMFSGMAKLLKFRPENGMTVIVSAGLTVYEKGGYYQLRVTDMQPDGAGAQAVALEQLKKKLSAMGVFDTSAKRPLPALPKTVGVITSGKGAALQDILNILGRRCPLVSVKVFPVLVQGEDAPAEIARAVRFAGSQDCDVLILGRGGGSSEDLGAFNTEAVVLAIFDCPVPLISAVGHEPDVTISDFVADRRASTPSNAAEIAVPDRHEMEELLSSVAARLNHAVSRDLQKRRQHLDSLRNRGVLRDASSFVDLRRMDVDRMAAKLASAGQKLVFERRRVLVRQAAALDAMSPLKVLSRGYVAANDGHGAPVCSVRQLKKGDPVTLRFSDGKADCLVEQLEEVDRHGTQETVI